LSKNNKWALLIGINTYKYFRELKGCINDVELMTTVLQERFGFPSNHITRLLDEQATRKGILTALEELLERINPNDIVVIHYSGHGSRMTDREGDKPDGMDETIIPYDSCHSTDNLDITDDELYIWLLRLSEKTPYITLVFDSCHSGGIVRDAFGTSDRWVEPDTRPIKELPPSPVTSTLVRGAERNIGPSGWLPLNQRYVLIAACLASQKAPEYLVMEYSDKIYYGTLTYFLCQELRLVESGTTYRDVFERASARVTATNVLQHPQIEGARDRELFNVHEIQSMQFVQINERQSNQVTLTAGAAHGMTVGSQWATYSPGTKQIIEETPRLGIVKITVVRAVSSNAEIIEERQTGDITKGCRAVQETHFYGEMRLKIDIQIHNDYKAAINELLPLISQSALLRLIEEGETADVRIYIVAPRTEVTEGDPVPQLKAVTKPTWAVVGQDGHLIIPTHVLDEPNVTALLRKNLEKIVRYRSALSLKNPNPSSLLKDKVEFILKRKGSDGTWIEAKPEVNQWLPVFEEGDRLIFEIVNHYQYPIYISILDFGLTYGVNQLYPVTGASQRFDPAKKNDIGLRQGEEIELYLPDNFPDSQVGGTETFKIFATIYPADFSLLLQGGLRQGDPLLEQLLNMALTGEGDREARVIRPPQNQEWTTVERSFFLKRRAYPN
jgi:hypothetical protein